MLEMERYPLEWNADVPSKFFKSIVHHPYWNLGLSIDRHRKADASRSSSGPSRLLVEAIRLFGPAIVSCKQESRCVIMSIEVRTVDDSLTKIKSIQTIYVCERR